ncbi:MAG TPA: DUF2339 domain-containing protein [Bacteroidota bacterium]|nr:DUF2339 domain-containing protein [Bacteroidota bacterium]
MANVFWILLSTGCIAGLFVIAAITLRTSKQLKLLERRMTQFTSMDRRLAELEAKLRDTARQVVEPPSPEAPAHPEVSPLSITQQPTRVPTDTAAPSAHAFAEPATAPSRTREEWEQLIGGNLLNRVGALALTIALGSFLKYAFDNNWISETIRVLIGALTGVVCLAGGYRTHRRGFTIFAQGLVGAGISILYLSVYASFNFYSLVPQTAAFILMFLVTLIAFANALYYDSLAEAMLGWAGGFLTPLLLSTGTANEIGLFGYITVLDAGLIAIMMRKQSWYVIEPLTLIGTWILYQQWFEAFYTSADLWTTVFFAITFWALFLALDVMWSAPAHIGRALNELTGTMNAACFFLAMYWMFESDHHAWMGLITVLIGSVYALILLQRSGSGHTDERLNLRYGLTGLALAVIATAIQFSDFTTVIAWSAEALLLVWYGRRLNLNYAGTAGFVVFLLAASKLLLFTPGAFAYAQIHHYSPVLNQRALAFGVLALAMWGGARLKQESRTGSKFFDALHYAWMLVLFLLLTAELTDFFQRQIDIVAQTVGRSSTDAATSHRLLNMQQMSLSGIWLVYSGILMGFGLLKKYREMRLAAIALFGISIIKIFIYDLSFLETLYRIFSFLALGVILLAVSYAYQKYRDVIIGTNIIEESIIHANKKEAQRDRTA